MEREAQSETAQSASGIGIERMKWRPKRIQRSRAKGWRMPEGAIYVGRPTWFGNPWRVGGYVDEFAATSADERLLPRDMVTWFGRRANETIASDAEAVEMYRYWIMDCANRNVPLPIGRLRGHDLACWCALDVPCHADVLLEISNGLPGSYPPPLWTDVTWGRGITRPPADRQAARSAIIANCPPELPIGMDVKLFHVVDISDEIKKLVPPTWHIAQTGEHLGRDLRDLENEIASGLSIKWPVMLGDGFQGAYESESDCANVAVGMMRRRPELELWVKCSDPEWRPTYRPLAHVEVLSTCSLHDDADVPRSARSP